MELLQGKEKAIEEFLARRKPVPSNHQMADGQIDHHPSPQWLLRFQAVRLPLGQVDRPASHPRSGYQRNNAPSKCKRDWNIAILWNLVTGPTRLGIDMVPLIAGPGVGGSAITSTATAPQLRSANSVDRRLLLSPALSTEHQSPA